MLGNLLNQTQQDNWKGSNHSADRPTQLKRAGKAMEEASYALELAQPHQLMDQAAAVVTCLDVAEVDVATFAKPFGVLLATVRTKYESLTHDVGEESSQQELAQQWRLLDGYFARGQSLQASTLAREWLVSLTCWQLGAKWDSRNSRYAAEGSLNRRTDRKVSLEPTEQSTDSARDHIPHIDTIVDIWGELRDLRNQIAHCGMASQDIPATTLHKNVLGLRERIRVIARSCGVISAPTT